MSFRDPRELRHEAKRLEATATAIEDGTWGAVVHGPGTSDAVAREVGCSLTGANNRLRRLYDFGLLDRERISVPGGGKQFAYRVAVKGEEGRRDD